MADLKKHYDSLKDMDRVKAKSRVKFKFNVGDKIKVPQIVSQGKKMFSAKIVERYAAKQNDGNYFPFYWIVGDWENAGKLLYDEDKIIEYGNKPKYAKGSEVGDSKGSSVKIKTSFYKWGQYQNEEEVDEIDLPVIELTQEQLLGFDIREEDRDKYFYASDNDIDEDDDGVSVKRSWATKKKHEPKYESGGGVGCPCKLKKYCEGGVAGDSDCADCPCQKEAKKDSAWHYTVGGF